MNKDKIIKDLKKRNAKLKNQNELKNIRCCHLEQENKQLKEVVNKIKKHCEIEINASNHYLRNHSSQRELCHKVAHQRILDILKEVSE